MKNFKYLDRFFCYVVDCFNFVLICIIVTLVLLLGFFSGIPVFIDKFTCEIKGEESYLFEEGKKCKEKIWK